MGQRENTVDIPERRTQRKTVIMSTENMKSSIETDEKEDCRLAEETIEKEQAKLRLMRALVEKKDPSSNEFDDLILRRFLRARGLDIEKGSTMFLKYLKWRQTFIPKGSVSPSEIPNEIAQNKMFSQGFDKKGRPIGVVFGARHFQNKGGFVVYILDKLCEKMPPGQEKFVVIGDLKGWGYSNSDLRAYLEAFSILQLHPEPHRTNSSFIVIKEMKRNVFLHIWEKRKTRLIYNPKNGFKTEDYYPERLGQMFIVHAPYIFMTVWKAVYPFIDNNTKEKIVFVEDKKLKSTLLEEMD